MTVMQKKIKILKEYIAKLDNVAVAFSGGVDSTVLLSLASQVLGDRVLAVTADIPSFQRKELEHTKQFCQKNNIRQEFCVIDQLAIKSFTQNPTDRCYICKKEIFKSIISKAEKNNIKYIAEGSNIDDNKDYRPGMRAIQELGVKSPFLDCGITKQDIREIAAHMGLEEYNKPSLACLATRIAYGEVITKEKLSMIEKAEILLHDMGFEQVRVRMHGDMARIELMPEQYGLLLSEKCRLQINDYLKNIGFSYVALDLQGYRTGSMNIQMKGK